MLFVHSLILHAQSPSYVFRHITTENGLASNGPFSIIQDSKGLIWISTSKGLQQFDGNAFVSYHHDPADTNSLRMENGYCLLEDTEGKIWLSQWPWGFCRFDPQTGKAVIINDSTSEQKSRNLNYCINACNNYLGNIWLCSVNLISKYDIKTHRIESFPNAVPENADFTKYMSYDSKTHKIWLGSYRYGICVFDTDNHTFYNKLNNPKHIAGLDFKYPVGAMLVTESDIWVNSYSSILYRYNFASGKWQQVYLEQTQEPRFGSISKETEKGNMPIDCIIEDRHRNVWFGARSHGLLEYSYSDLSLHLVKRTSIYAEKQDLNYNDYLGGIFEDNDANIWLSTDNGIYIFNPNSQKFSSALLRSPGDLPDTKFQALNCLERNNGDIWVTTFGGGIFVFDQSLRFKERFISKMAHSHFNGSRVLKSNLVWCLLEQSNGEIVVGSQGGWLSIYSPRRKRFTHIQPEALKHLTISNMFLTRKKISGWHNTVLFLNGT